MILAKRKDDNGRKQGFPRWEPGPHDVLKEDFDRRRPNPGTWDFSDFWLDKPKPEDMPDSVRDYWALKTIIEGMSRTPTAADRPIAGSPTKNEKRGIFVVGDVEYDLGREVLDVSPGMDGQYNPFPESREMVHPFLLNAYDALCSAFAKRCQMHGLRIESEETNHIDEGYLIVCDEVGGYIETGVESMLLHEVDTISRMDQEQEKEFVLIMYADPENEEKAVYQMQTAEDQEFRVIAAGVLYRNKEGTRENFRLDVRRGSRSRE